MRDALGLKSYGRSPGPVPPAFAERYQAKENVSPTLRHKTLSTRPQAHLQAKETRQHATQNAQPPLERPPSELI
jgi:hypothetical protein